LHLGHIVSEDTVLERYKSSYQRILENLNAFNEIHFYDASGLIPKKVFEVVEGSINDVKENYSFKWSDKLIDLILNLRDQKG
jgi:predicted ABC-type ATPase